MNKVLYDKDCGVCENFASFISKKSSKFKFIPFKSKDGKKILLLEGSDVFFGSCAIFKLFKNLTFPYNFFYLFFYVPKFIREPIYCLFAKYRYKFSKNSSCSV